MADWSKFVESILPGLLTGASSAVGTVYAFLNNLKKKIEDAEAQVKALDAMVKALDSRIGSYDPVSGNRSGYFKAHHDLELQVQALKTVVGGFDPILGNKTGLLKAVEELHRPGERGPSFDTQHIEERVERRLGARLEAIEARVAELGEAVSQCVTYENYQDSASKRAEDLTKIRESIANLSGILSVVKGYLDPTPPKRSAPK